MGKPVSLVYLSISVFLVQSKPEEAVGKIKDIYIEDTMGLLNTNKNVTCKYSDSNFQQETLKLNEKGFPGPSTTKVDPVKDSTKDKTSTLDFISKHATTLRRSVARNLESSTKQSQVVSAVKVKMDEAIYLNFEEKERHDGFKKTDPEENPFAVLITVVHQWNTGPMKFCSGSLLTAQWNLTAAHCFYLEKDKVTIYAGGNSITEVEQGNIPTVAQLRKSQTYYKHPNYKLGSMYDVAIITVEPAYKMTSTVNTVQLTRVPWTDDRYKACKFTGFGVVYRNKNDTDDLTRKTHEIEVRHECVCLPRDVQDSVMCSRPREDYGICKGDSGGGLVCDDKLVAVAKGNLNVGDDENCRILTTHPECGLKSMVSVFLKADLYLDWVHSQINMDNSELLNGLTTSKSSSCLVVIAVLVVLYEVYQNI